MIVLADNDIILKLAQCDLIGDLADILGEPVDEIFATPTAPYQLLPKKADKALEKCGCEATVQRIKNFLNAASEIPAIQDDLLLQALVSINGIDDGEALLFAAATELPTPMLITGDRRALCALLANHDRLLTVSAALQGKVVTFESAILLALRKLGFAIVKQKLLSSPKPDAMLRLVLKSDMRESDLVECLTSYSKEVEPLLAFRQFLFLRQ